VPALPRHVYVHVPFCARKCSYCDFAIAVRRAVPVDEFVRAVEQELGLRYPAAVHHPIETLYLGGGTPSRLGADGVARLLDVIRRSFAPDGDAEITIEANPDDVSMAAAAVWRDAGINRVSLGAQSFSDEALRWMHRTHDSAAIPRAVDDLRAAGFDDVSLDLIFALPETVARDWQSDVEQALALRPTHVSLYGLTIEPMTPLGRWRARGEVTETPEEQYEIEYLHADDTMRMSGLEHYEVSNFAGPGSRARHNSSYWRHVPYAGIGPGAHEFDGETRRWNRGGYAEWVRRLGQSEDPIEGSESLTDDNRIAEVVYLGLRTVDGLELIEPELWVDAGWAEVSGARLRLTPTGWLRLDALAADLTLFRSRS
jgi:oxygen-independent coproporphyrinogen-3 oxidase